MKAFYVSVVLFLFMATIIIANAIYINRTADKLMLMTASLPAPDNEKYEECITDLQTFWKRNYSAISLSVNLNDLNKISDNMSQLIAYSTNQNNQDFEATRKLLVNSIWNMQRLEQISLDSIM